jgi:hypothetical protein
MRRHDLLKRVGLEQAAEVAVQPPSHVAARGLDTGVTALSGVL